MIRLASILGLVGLILFANGCASTMMVFTEPGNAEILVDGEVVGWSPVLYAGRSGLDGAVEVTARLAGYQDATLFVARHPDIAHLGESLIFPVFFPWSWYPPDAVTIPLHPIAQ